MDRICVWRWIFDPVRRTTPPITSTVMDAREVTETRPVAMETTISSLRVELSCRKQKDVFSDSSESAELFP